MKDLTDQFFAAYLEVFPSKTVFTSDVPKEMMASSVDEDGWVEWRLLKGTLHEDDYLRSEEQFNVKFPHSFIEWHKAYFFLDCDCSIVRLPYSSPVSPLKEINGMLDWFIPQQIIPQKLYPFASDGNDVGVLVFDAREPKVDNEFPIRLYDHEYLGEITGLSEIIFSSFNKLIACLTHYLQQLKHRKNFEIIPDFFQIDPDGAGKSGKEYWLEWAGMMKANFEEFGD